MRAVIVPSQSQPASGALSASGPSATTCPPSVRGQRDGDVRHVDVEDVELRPAPQPCATRGAQPERAGSPKVEGYGCSRAPARRLRGAGAAPGHGHSPPSTSQPSGCQTSSRTASAPGSARRTSRSVSPGRAVSARPRRPRPRPPDTRIRGLRTTDARTGSPAPAASRPPSAPAASAVIRIGEYISWTCQTSGRGRFQASKIPQSPSPRRKTPGSAG